MKLLFGAIASAMMIAFLASFVIKVQEPMMMAVVLVGVILMLVDAWNARNEADT
jgi:hypothetical protein